MTPRTLLLVAMLATLAAACGKSPLTVGRYWAQLHGRGTTDAPRAVHFEYKLHPDTTWTTTPIRTVPKGTSLDAHTEWLFGLQPGTTYDVRFCVDVTCSDLDSITTAAPPPMQWIEVDPTTPEHLRLVTGERFIAWGNNYVRPSGTAGLYDLVEDVMGTEAGLTAIDADLRRLANVAPPDGRQTVIRMHLQLGEFLTGPTTIDREALARYAHVIELAEDHGLRVMVTGLNYFYPADNPAWIGQQTDEAEHWASQALWWRSMASALRHSPGVFAYDLMNEPYVGGSKLGADGLVWWTNVSPTGYCDYGGDPNTGRHGTCFGQFVSPDQGGRTAAEVAAEWARQMVEAIRQSGDDRHLVTIGVGAFGLANVFNGSTAVHQHLDFLSPHLYPDKNNGQDAIDLAAGLRALTTKPIIAGETFTFGPADRLISNACNDGSVQGWFGQYDGRVLGDPCPSERGVWGCVLYDAWYQVERDYGPTILAGGCPARVP